MKFIYETYKLTLFNTITGVKQEFKPESIDCVKMYVCGITPYDWPHIGHARCYVFFDTLYRLLKFLGYNVKYCRNITDIEDKLIKKAQIELGDPCKFKEISDKYIQIFNQQLAQLNCENPDLVPAVTDTISEIIDFINQLIKKGHAYESGGDVYFRINSFKHYGKLSKRDLNSLKIGARVDVSDLKENLLDFALWKKALEKPGWESIWSFGRPGWHIECSAMIKKLLGDYVDIHGGGMDLIFPHHENEVAQSESLTGRNFCNNWLHVAFVQINKEKMSKSLNNFVTIKDVFETIDPMVFRYYLLSHNYRIPIDYLSEDLISFKKSYEKLFNLLNSENTGVYNHFDSTLFVKLLGTICDDINIAKCFGIIFENSDLIRSSLNEKMGVKYFVENILGIKLYSLSSLKHETEEIKTLIKQREEARKMKDWARADQIRDKLRELGFELQDTKIK